MQLFFRLRPLLAGLFALCCALPTTFAQLGKHGQIWHFGNHAALDFSSGAPVMISGSAMDSYEGCSSYCDANGQLLFYSNGGGYTDNIINGVRRGYIWNRNNQVMYDMGQTEGGGYSAAQSALVLPKPGAPDHYYQFTMDHIPTPLANNRGLSYFEVDMTANGGLGAVVQANMPVYKPASECLTAVPNTNGQDFWLITVDRNVESFVVIPLTAGGFGQPLLQTPGGQHPDLDVVILKVSPDGRFLYAGNNLYAFDATTGTLTFLKALNLDTYSFSFSPGSHYLYGFDVTAAADMVRYDLLDLNAPKMKINANLIISFNGMMQIGPDGNIYLTAQLLEDFLEFVPPVSLSVIHCPDSEMPQLEVSVMKFPTDMNNAGGLFTSLPNFADYIFATKTSHDTLYYPICKEDILDAPQIGLHYQWSTGDTTWRIIVHEPGTYTVQVDDACSSYLTTFMVTQVHAPGPVHITYDPIPADTCQALPLTLSVTSSDSMFVGIWSDGSSANTLLITEFGIYTFTAQDICGTASDTFQLLPPVNGCCHPTFPNAFTPNGDGINDRFSGIFDQCDLEYADFLVYDRWGELIFQGYEVTEQWDGRNLNGAEAPSDVYVYVIHYKRRDQAQEQVKKGEITLLR